MDHAAQDANEILFLKNAVAMAKTVRRDLVRQAAQGGVTFVQLREFDEGIKQCEAEIRRSV